MSGRGQKKVRVSKKRRKRNEPKKDAAGKTPSTRRCIVTRSKAPKQTLLRFVSGPDDALLFDVRQRMAGRGVYVRARSLDIERACQRGAFKRGLQLDTLQVPAAETLINDILLPALERCYLETLSLGRGCGQLLCGSHKVDRAARSGQLRGYMLASDASPGTSKKIQQAARALDLPLYQSPLDRLALGATVGRDQAVVFGWCGGPLLERARCLEQQLEGLGWQPVVQSSSPPTETSQTEAETVTIEDNVEKT